MCVCEFPCSGLLQGRGFDSLLAMLLFFGALALHCRQLDLKLRLDFLWATQVCVCVCLCVCVKVSLGPLYNVSDRERERVCV